jgi:cob(I)alamin adenosyltransferase
MNFVDPNDPDPADVEIARQGMATARDAIASGDYHLVVLDEVNVAVNLGLVEEDELLAMVDARPEHVEVVLTGRDASSRIIERADLVTEMRMVKHFYEAGIPARRGIEF